MSDREREKETGKESFTERTIMALVAAESELREAALRVGVMVAALALAHGISTDV